MNNPLSKRSDDAPIIHQSEERLREWCWKKNQDCMNAKFPHWLYVSRDKDTNRAICKARSGSDALDVLKLLDGWYPDFKGWDQDRLDSEFRILRHAARMGMPESEWPSRSRRIARAPMNAAA